MTDLLPFIIAGLTTGSVYALAGSGLVLTYKTSGIFNFGHGALATIAVYVMYYLYVEVGLSLVVSLMISVLGVGLVLGLLMERLARSLTTVPVALQAAATVGLILAAQSGAHLAFGSSSLTFPSYMPIGSVEVMGTAISFEQLIIMAIALIATVGIAVFFRKARLGVAMRGVVDDPTLLAMTGVSPIALQRVAWVVGTTFVCLSGVLLAPSVNLDALVLTLLVVQAFGAAAVGRFSSIPMTYVGGLGIGVLAALVTRYVSSSNQYLSGLGQSLPFIVLFIVLIVTPRSKLVDRRFTMARPHKVWRAPARIQIVAGGLLLVVLLLGPMWFGAHLTSFTIALTYVVLFLSLGLLVKNSNQVSLAHMGFAAIGCVVFSKAYNDWNLPWFAALTAAAVVAVPIGALIALPALRLSGIFLALATFAFGLVLETMFYNSELMFGPSTAGLPMARPHFLGMDTDRGYYYLVLACVTVCTLIIVLIQRTRLGRLLRGLGESSVALETQGASVRVTKLIVFCLASSLAAVAGALYGGNFSSVGGLSFPSFSSLTLLVLMLLMLGGAPWYALMGAFCLIVLPTFLPGGETAHNILTLFFGVSVVLSGLQKGRHPALPVAITEFLDRVGGRTPGPDAPIEPAGADGLVVAENSTDTNEFMNPVAGSQDSGLEVKNLQIKFGGNTAVDDLSLTAPVGRITALIGPNGAGKTTSFNACSGLLKPTAGKVFLKGRDISSLRPFARAQLGIGRTFQRMQLFDSMTVAENVSVGREAALAGGNFLTQIFSKRGDGSQMHDAAADAMRLCGISHLANVQAGLLSVGQRRLVELARTLAGSFDVVLLDEPSSGLDRAETEAFGRVLQRVVRERGIGVLLVEHDMSLVLKICTHIYVLDFGKLIFEGSPTEVVESETVRTAYLGGADEADSFGSTDAGALA